MQTKIKIELLAPAKDLEVGKAAIDAGADAVYIGAPMFSARKAAGNSIEDIEQLCQYAHLFSVKVLVALNTLLTDEERRKAVALAWQLYQAGADALIIQDLNLLKEDMPPIRLHASTQCDNRTVDDILQRQSQGFKRAVLARELSLNDIRVIRQATNIELETFVHGALCVSYSGRCYMSERMLGRSANRGNCAQLCRWQYDLLDKDRNLLESGKYALSLRDMDRSSYLKELLDAGVTTLKIEGRLKDKAYVSNITAYYRLLLDRLFAEPDSPYCRASKGKLYIDFEPNPEKTFHRSSTDYFLHCRTGNLANWHTPKSTGEYIGKVLAVGQNYLDIQTDIALNNGDGLCFADQGFMINKTQELTAAQKKLIRIYPNSMQNIKIGTALYRNFDFAFARTLENSRSVRKLPVDIIFSETDEGFSLRIGNAEQSFVYQKTPAINRQRAFNTIRSSLLKLGDTVLEASSVTIDLQQAYFIAASVLNSWRRTVAEMACKLAVDEEKSEKSAATYAVDEWQNNEANDSTFRTPNADDMPLMTCRYCILFEMGICRKQKRNKDMVEPMYLQSGKHLFRLKFCCERCEMTIHED